ncbi:MAG: lysophospholipid acyltransferase family protein, partial [Myxococcota bacterium]
CLKAWGLIGYGSRLALPDALKDQPFVLVANHPSLIDVLFLLHWFPGTTCVVKSAWRNNFFFGPLLRSVDYLPNHHPKDDAFTGALERMKTHVRKGHPLIVFPEGTRSHDTKLHRFRRGAFEVAAECGVPVLVMFIGVDPPTLAKGESFSHRRRGEFTFEVLDVLRGNDSRALKAQAEETIGARFDVFLRAVGRLEPSRPEVAATAS